MQGIKAILRRICAVICSVRGWRFLLVFERYIVGLVGRESERMQVMVSKPLIELIIFTTPPKEIVRKPINLDKLVPGNSKCSTNHFCIRQVVTKLIQTGSPGKKKIRDDHNRNTYMCLGREKQR